jgi:hypothetical protein
LQERRRRDGSPLGGRGLAEDAGRKTIAEFVTIWLLKETDWKRDPAHKVVVLFPGEARPPLP